MTQQPHYSDELDGLEDDIRVLRTLVDAAVERHDAAAAHALSEIIDDRKTRLHRVMREGSTHGSEHAASRKRPTGSTRSNSTSA